MNVITNSGFTVEQINQAIEAMAKSQHRAVLSVARVIVMAAWAANVNKDAGVANALMKNLRKGTRKQGVVACLESIANLGYVSGTFAYFDAKKGYSEDEAKEIKVAAASWENFKPAEKEADDTDCAEAFDAFVTKLGKTHAKGKLTHAKLLVRLVELNAEIKGELVLSSDANS